MIALIQRVSQAKVDVDKQTVGEIGHGLLVLLGVQKDDDHVKADRLIEKVLNYRVFSDAEGKMNLNVQQVKGQVLVVSQFTLAADTQKGCVQVFRVAQALIWQKHYTTMWSKSAVKKFQLSVGNLPQICKSA